jgi:hypothetical protein
MSSSMPLQPSWMTCSTSMFTSVVKTIGLLAFELRPYLVDLAHGLVRLVGGVGEGQPDLADLHLELGQDGLAKGLGGDAGAVGDEKDGAVGHGGRSVIGTPRL